LGSPAIEAVTIPHDLVATVDGRSSIGRLAVVIHATAGFIDPGFEGQITLELSNVSAAGQMPELAVAERSAASGALLRGRRTGTPKAAPKYVATRDHQS
jgi:hypothetical protein